MLKLTKESKNHTHIAYIRNQIDTESIQPDGRAIIGITSKDNGHQHEIWFMPERDVVNPQTGQVERIPKSIFMEEVNGHTHEILDENLSVSSKSRNKKSSSDDRLSEYMNVAIDAFNSDQEFYTNQAEESEQLYFGGEYQWPENVRKQLMESGRPMLTFNTIKSKINSIIGAFSLNPVMPKIKPNEASDARLADILNALNMHLFSSSDFVNIQRDVFTDQVITGRGNIDLKIDTSVNPEGDPVIRHVGWDSVNYTPHEKKDLSDCEAVVQCSWVSKGYLKMMAPKSMHDQIDNLSSSESASVFSNNQGRFQFFNSATNKFRLMHVTKKEYHTRSIIFNPTDDYFLDGQEGRVPAWLLDSKTKKRILSIPGFVSQDKVVSEYWVGVIGANLLLYDRISEFNGFLTIPSYATKRKNMVKGEIFDLKDPQHEKNKRQTMYIENLMKYASDVTYIDDSTFGGDELKKMNYMQERHRPSAIIEVDNVDKPPREKSPPRFPSELLTLADFMEKDMDLISGFNNQGVSGSQSVSSTPLFNARRRNALASIDYLFSNFNIMLRLLAFRLVDMYRILYTPERVYRILESQDREMLSSGRKGLALDGIPFKNYSPTELTKLWSRLDTFKYDISVDVAPYSLTKSDDDFVTFATLGQQGVPGINADFLLELKNDINPELKDKLIEISRQAQEQQSKMAGLSGQLEMQKVALGQQGQTERLDKKLRNDNLQLSAKLEAQKEKYLRETN